MVGDPPTRWGGGIHEGGVWGEGISTEKKKNKNKAEKRKEEAKKRKEEEEEGAVCASHVKEWNLQEKENIARTQHS